MPDKIDMSLDDIIKTNKPRGGARGGAAAGRGGNRGIGARFNNNNNNSRTGNRSLNRRPLGGGVAKRRSGSGGATLRKPARVPDGKWLHDLYGGQAAAARRSGGGLVSASNSGPATITISNLDFGVNDKDIQDLFEEFGAIRKAAVHYDRSGRSLGTADVVFEKRQDALKAVKKYNGVQLDGRAMNIQIAESAQRTLSAPAVPIRAGLSPRRGTSFRPSVAGLRRGGFSGGFNRGRGGARGGNARGGRGGRGGANRVQKTAAELDADLDTYTTKMVTD